MATSMTTSVNVGDIIDSTKLKLDTENDVEALVQGIEGCDGLDTLVLSGRSYGVEASEAIGRTLRGKSSLKKALWSDMFVSKLKTEIPLALAALGEGIMAAGAQLVELDLSDNALGPNGIVGVMDLLRSPACFTLKVIKFNNGGLGIGGGQMLSKALLQTHQAAADAGGLFAPEVFVAGRNRLEDDGAAALAELFATIKTFKEIRMPQNSIYKKGIASLAQALLLNKDLQCLDLSDNSFTEAGAVSMAETLSQLENLSVVNFEDCLVRSEGAVAIGNALKDGHGQLEEVNLSSNEIKIGAAMTVANDLCRSNSLQRLLLGGNCFGEEGCLQLQDFMVGKGKEDVLGSLSEDEGDSDDDDNVEEEEEEGKHRGKSEVVEEEDREKAAANNSSQESGVQVLSPDEERELGEEFKPFDVVKVFVNITSSYHRDEDQQHKSALEGCVDSVLTRMVEKNEQAMSTFLNELLVTVGLLKGEDKQFVPIEDKEGPLLMLSWLCSKPYFLRTHSNVLMAFLTKSSKTVDIHAKTRDQLLQALHSR